MDSWLEQALQQVPQQQQAPQQVPQQVQHSPPQQRPTAPQQTNQVPNASQPLSPSVANRQQQPLVRPSMSPTAQAPMPQPMHQSRAMSPQLSQQGIQQGQQPVQQQTTRQIPVPVQQIPGGPPAVRQSPAPGTPATPAQHPQQVRDASVPPRPGSAAPVVPTVQGQVPVMPQQGQQLASQPGQQQQVPPRMAGASAQSPPPQQQIPQLPDRGTNRMPIPKTLSIEPKGPVPIQTRPTLSGGANTAGSHVMGTPALVKNPAFEFDEGGMGLLSKRKLEELVKQIDPDEKLDPEVEESVLELVDEFIDTVVTYACKMAKLRGSDTLDIKDMQIILERNWNIRVPGYAADEIRTVRKFAPAQGYVQKMNALAAGKALNQTNLKGGD
ncbi:transcription initiation factor TFIID subunit A-domain-containing protein [Tirmania nivea]|nr:transcription initiation factor TFIID subunit A-domain-containing protein [Tirmania nivea]